MDYCPKCTRHWRSGQPIQAYQDEQTYAAWDAPYNDWEKSHWVGPGQSPRQRTTSPRDRQPKKARRRKNRAAAQQHGREQSQGRQPPQPGPAQRPVAPPPPPPLPSAPQWAHLPTVASAADAAAPPPSAEAQQLKECLALLSKNEENLPSELLTYMQGIKAKDVKRSVKTLHSAVTVMGKARDELQAAITARAQMHSTWRTFLADSIARFQTYGQDFAHQEETLVKRIQAANTAFAQAKENLSVEKAKASTLESEVQEVSDDDVEIKDISLTSPDKITESLTHLTTSLQELKSQADIMEKEEQKHKRPRLADASEGIPAGEPSTSF